MKKVKTPGPGDVLIAPPSTIAIALCTSETGKRGIAIMITPHGKPTASHVIGPAQAVEIAEALANLVVTAGKEDSCDVN